MTKPPDAQVQPHSRRGCNFRCEKHARAVSPFLISTGTRGSYAWRSGGAPASHLTQGSKRPMALDRPSAVITQGRLLQGG